MPDTPFQIPWRELWPPACPACDYCWTGLSTPRCPECGFTLPHDELLLFGIEMSMTHAGAGSLWTIAYIVSAALVLNGIETYRGWTPGIFPMLNGAFGFVLALMLRGIPG